MTQIKKLKNSQGTQVYPQTHTKAVIDDNGYTAESRLQAMQDEINQAQLEVGAVPSDLTPTENSTNWVTSGGIYDSISTINEELYGIIINNTYTSGIYVNQSNGQIRTNSNWALTDYIPCVTGDTVRVLFRTTGSTGISMASFYNASKVWNQSYTTNNYTNERTVTSTVEGTAYVRCGLYLPKITQCEVYINDVLVWNYAGKASSGITDEIEKIPQIESDIAELKEADKCKFATSFGTLKSPSYCIATSNIWSSTTKHSVYFKEVTEGDVYRFLGNATNCGFYAFLKDTSMSSYGSPNYADGETGRHTIPINTESSDITVPATAVYLYICKTNDGTDQEPQALYKVAPTADTVESISEDVNNIKDKLGMNDGSSAGFSYYGEKISFYNTMSFTKYASNSVSGQSSAIYGDYLFIVKDQLTNVICYNMATKTVLYNLATGLSKDSTWHCNQCQFGTLRYSQDDMFPVLYITVNNNSQGRCSWVAYRIVPTLTDNEISSFTIEEVQTIYLPVMTDENCLGNLNIAVDYERGFLWGYGRNNRSGADNYMKATFARFPMPALSQQTVTYEDADIITSFKDTWSMGYAQGGFIKNGKLVIMQGYASVNLINLRVIDLYVAKRQVSYVSLLENGFTEEPEGVFFYNGGIYTSTNNSNIWVINV